MVFHTRSVYPVEGVKVLIFRDGWHNSGDAFAIAYFAEGDWWIEDEKILCDFVWTDLPEYEAAMYLRDNKAVDNA